LRWNLAGLFPGADIFAEVQVSDARQNEGNAKEPRPGFAGLFAWGDGKPSRQNHENNGNPDAVKEPVTLFEQTVPVGFPASADSRQLEQVRRRKSKSTDETGHEGGHREFAQTVSLEVKQ